MRDHVLTVVTDADLTVALPARTPRWVSCWSRSAASKGLGSVRVNDGTGCGFDTSRPVVDVTAGLRSGTNTVHVRVASSLNNRLLARGYYDQVPDIAAKLFGLGERMQRTEVHDHGLLGPVRLLREVS